MAATWRDPCSKDRANSEDRKMPGISVTSRKLSKSWWESVQIGNMNPIPSMKLTRRARTILLMLAGLSTVLAIGLWDAHHEDELALQQLMAEQHFLARALCATLESDQDLEPHGNQRRATDKGFQPAVFRAAASQLEDRGNVVVLLMNSTLDNFLTTRNIGVSIEPLKLAFLRGNDGLKLDRDMAARLGLPRRVAVAGLAATDPRDRAYFRGVAVVTSAEAERDRNRREELRTVFGILIVSTLVVGAGLSALRSQRRQLALEGQQAVHQMERARDAELARANRMATIAALSSGIAHEISTPLGVITGRIEQLRAVIQGQSRYERLLDNIASQVERVDNVMRGFLALARGAAPESEPIAANELAASVVEQVKYRFANAQVQLFYVPCADRDLIVRCVSTLFDQVLIDVLINALEASKFGDRVTLSVTRDASSACFLITDEGTGISDSIVARATEPFFTTKGTRGGTGLGLAIAREIVLHHRGEILLERRSKVEGPGQPGTRVTVRIPLAEETQHEPNA